MINRLRNAGYGVAAILAVALSLASLRYVVFPAPFAPEGVAHNAFVYPWLPIHAVLSAIALFIGPWQFFRTKTGGRWKWHRWAGRLYAATCLCSAPTGLILAFGTTTGPISTAGFGSLAVAWFCCTSLGWVAARERRFDDHRAWMIRSYVLTFAAVTLRLYLPVILLTHLSFVPSYRAISFLCWVPNLILAEMYLRGAPQLRPVRLN